MKYKKKPKAGFTLLEVIIAIAVIAILGTALLSFVSASGNVFKSIQADYNVENEARIALSYITIKVRQNDYTYGTPPLNSVTLENESDGTQHLNILNAGDKKAVWQINFDGNAIKELYYQNGLSETATDTGVIAENLDNVYFNYDSIQKLLSITITYTVKGGSTRTLDGKVYLRSE